MAAFTVREEYLNDIIDGILTALGITSWPSDDGDAFIDEFITIESETSELRGVGIGAARAFFNWKKSRLPGIIIDPETEVEEDRSGTYGGVQSPAYIYKLKIYYVMDREGTDDEWGTIKSNPSRLVLARAGVIRGVLNDSDNWRIAVDGVNIATECGQPTLVNELMDEWKIMDNTERIAARMDLFCALNEDLTS